jgi:hypothetical protein
VFDLAAAGSLGRSSRVAGEHLAGALARGSERRKSNPIKNTQPAALFTANFRLTTRPLSELKESECVWGRRSLLRHGGGRQANQNAGPIEETTIGRIAEIQPHR